MNKDIDLAWAIACAFDYFGNEFKYVHYTLREQAQMVQVYLREQKGIRVSLKHVLEHILDS